MQEGKQNLPQANIWQKNARMEIRDRIIRIFVARSLQRTSDTKLVNKCISQVGNHSVITSLTLFTVADSHLICSSYSMFVHMLSWSPGPED